MTLLLYFALGVVFDYMLTRYYLAIYQRRLFWGPALATVVTLFSTFILAALIKGNLLLPMAAWAIGNGLGTYLGLRRT
jgi:hypothetical protein